MKEKNIDGFTERMREALREKGLFIKSVGKMIGVSQSAMNCYANGKSSPPLNVAVQIARLLGVSLDWLCGLSGNKHLGKDGDMLYADVMQSLKRAAINNGNPRISAIKSEKDSELCICMNDVLPSEKINEWSSLHQNFKEGRITTQLYSFWFDSVIEEIREGSHD